MMILSPNFIFANRFSLQDLKPVNILPQFGIQTQPMLMPKANVRCDFYSKHVIQLLAILETGKSRQEEVHKQMFVTATKYESALICQLEACKIMIKELISVKSFFLNP